MIDLKRANAYRFHWKAPAASPTLILFAPAAWETGAWPSRVAFKAWSILSGSGYSYGTAVSFRDVLVTPTSRTITVSLAY